MGLNISQLSGSGVFLTKALGIYDSVSSGSSGTLITLTPPANQRVMLESLSVSGSVPEPLITVNVGGSDVISGGTLDDGNASASIGTFCVGIRGGAPGDRVELYGDINEAITITKDSGVTASTVFYAYRYGV